MVSECASQSAMRTLRSVHTPKKHVCNFCVPARAVGIIHTIHELGTENVKTSESAVFFQQCKQTKLQYKQTR